MGLRLELSRVGWGRVVKGTVMGRVMAAVMEGEQ